MKTFFIPALISAVMQCLAQPATEVLLFEVRQKGKSLSIQNPVNISNNKGYDSQPFFDPKEPMVYFSSARENGRTDIRAFNWKTAKTLELTQTPEREYSPVVTPDGNHFSCIIQRDNGAQDLGTYPLPTAKTGFESRPAEILIDNLIIGYHAWLTHDEVVVFVLGEPQTLRIVDLRNGNNQILASGIGRSIHRIPGSADVSFVDKSDPSNWNIRRLNGKDRSISEVAKSVPGHEDMAWLPDGRLISSDGSRLLLYDMVKSNWIPIEGPMLKTITRLAVSPDGKKLAAVVEE